MACHLVPLDETLLNPGRGQPSLAYAAWSSLHVWGPGGLIQNLSAVAERRLLEGGRRGLVDKPFAGHVALHAGLDDVLAFLAGDTDDARIAALIQGLVWIELGMRQHDRGARSTIRLPSRRNVERPMPLAYALLKPLFVADRALRVSLRFSNARMRAPLTSGQSLPMPPDLIRLLAGGDWARALSGARRRLRASGLSCPFEVDRGVLPFDVRRLVAALFIPVKRVALARVIERVVPNITEEDDRGDTHAA